MTERERILNDKAESVYDNVTDVINRTYSANEGESDSFSSEGLSDFDGYLQALLVQVCIKSGKFTQKQANFIGSIVKYGSMSEDIDITLFGNCNYEMRDRLSEIASEKLKNVPKCINLSSAIDKKFDRKITETIFGGLLTLGYLVLKIEGNADLTEVKPHIKSIIDFMVENSLSVK